VGGARRPRGSKSKGRVLELSARIRPLIENHFAIHDTLGITPRTIQRLIPKVANCAEIRRKVTPHVLRHTFAVTAIQKGLSLSALQCLMGHDRLTSTELYLNLSTEEVLREFRAKR
jgi:integrase/recombinase XerD